MGVDAVHAQLKQWAEEFSGLCSLQQIGTSTRGVPLYVLIISRDIQNHNSYPGVWFDGCTHAGEWAGYMTCMYTAEQILGQPETHLPEGVTYYIDPFISPDGVKHIEEESLYVRSSPVDSHDSDLPLQGYHYKKLSDIPGQLQMRWASPAGSWKKSKENPNVMVPRRVFDVEETDGPFYFVTTECEVVGIPEEEISHNQPPFVGSHLMGNPDLNRNWPTNWSSSEGGGTGSGGYPGSYPEVASVLKFLEAHHNIVLLNTHHTHGGVHILSSPEEGRSGISVEDRGYNDFLGEIAERTSKYPTTYISEDTKSAGYVGDVSRGVFDDYAYFGLGILGTTTELWNPMEYFAPEELDKNWLFNFPKITREENLLKFQKYIMEHAPEHFHEWKEHTHPQLGKVEIGGFNFLKTFQNPPESLLEKEAKRVVDFNLELHKIVPKLFVAKVNKKKLSDDTYEILVSITNTGALPTYGTEKAKGKPWYKGITASAVTTGDVQVLSEASLYVEKDIPGSCLPRNQVLGSYFSSVFYPDRKDIPLRWIVKGKGKVKIQIESLKAGKVTAEIDL